MGAESLQKVFKTLSDPTRVRILALLAREELAVQAAFSLEASESHFGILFELSPVPL